MTTGDEPAHSELPPSSSDKWFNCHAWRRLNAGIADTTSAAAEEGTLAHEWFAEHLLGNKDLVDCPDPEMSDHLMMCVDWVEQQEGERFVETRVNFGDPFGYVGLTGTADLIFVDAEDITVADLKYGRGVVEAVDNTQMICYLIGAVYKYGRRKSYRLAILQPRAWHKDGVIRTWSLSDKTLREWEDKVKVAIAGSYDSKSLAIAGDWCQHYCKALGRCKAAARKSLDLFRSEPDD
jgi:hypothetical protein